MDMKKINFIFICASALSILACSKEPAPAVTVGKTVVEFSQPEQQAELTPDRYTVFYADLSASADSQTKVYIDEAYKTRWNAGDLISIFQTTANDCFEFQGNDGARSGSFTEVEQGNAGDDLDYIYAVYPYSANNSITTSGVLTVELPSSQSYVYKSYGPGANIMVCKTDGEQLFFKTVGGFLVIKLYGTNASVSSVTVSANAQESLAGVADVFYNDDVPQINITQGIPSISVVCDQPVALGTSATDYTEFWFALPPITLSQGFTVTVTGANGKTCEKKSSKERVIARNTITPMAPFEVVFPTNQIGDGEEQDGGDY